jgi:hypothetical protein
MARPKGGEAEALGRAFRAMEAVGSPPRRLDHESAIHLIADLCTYLEYLDEMRPMGEPRRTVGAGIRRALRLYRARADAQLAASGIEQCETNIARELERQNLRPSDLRQ